MELPTYECFVVFSQFGIKKPKLVPYSVAVFYRKSVVKHSPHILDILLEHVQEIAVGVKILVLKSKELGRLEPILTRSADHIERIIQCKGITCEEIELTQDQFYASAVTSHWQTQMTTVIEATSVDDAKKLLRILSCFTLPYQLALSSDVFEAVPTPGLYLQIVERQTTPIEEHLAKCNGPCTWIRLPERQIYQTPPVDIQKRIHEEYLFTSLTSYLDEEVDVKRKVNKLKQQTKANFNSTSPFVSAGLATACNARVPRAICNQMLNSMVRNAVTFIALVNDFLRTNGIHLVKSERALEFLKTLGMKGKHDTPTILAIAGIFDPLIYKKCSQVQTK